MCFQLVTFAKSAMVNLRNEAELNQIEHIGYKI